MDERASSRRHAEEFTIRLVDVADRAQGVIQVRDVFDRYCHNYERARDRYVEQRLRWDKRSPEQIREEFPRTFAENVKLKRAEGRAARNSYISAQDHALAAGIPRRCLRYVEFVDLCSEDSLELLEDDASNMRQTPRRRRRAGPLPEGTTGEQHRPRDKVADWRKDVDPNAPMEEIDLDYDVVLEMEGLE